MPPFQPRALQPQLLQLQARHAEERARHAEARVRELEAQRDASHARANDATRALQALQERLHALETSTSWRLAAPLRRMGESYPGLIRILRHATRLLRGRGTAMALEGDAASLPEDSRDASPGHAQEEGAAAPAFRPPPRGAHDTTILVVDHAVPRPDQDAGSRAIMDVMLCLLDAGWRIQFWPQNRVWVSDYTPALEALGIEVIDHRWSGSMESWLDEYGVDLDHVLVSRATVANEVIMQIVSRCTAHISYYGHDIGFVRLAMEADILNKPAMLDDVARMRAFERRLWRLFDRVIYLSEEEAAIVRELEPAAAARSVVPYSYETFVERETAPRSDTILFVAGFAHAPNVDAAEFLVYQVLPLIQARHPGAKVALVGSHPDWAVSALASPDVEVTGWVSEEDLMQRYRRSRVAVAPLRFGAGVKGKVVQALQQGLPVVVTPVGAQGIPGLDRIVPVREEPQEIAAAVLTLLADDAAWMAQSVAQSRFAEAHYSRAAMRVSLLRALQPTD